LRQTNDIYFQKISLFQRLCNDGNPPLISLHELNASAIVRKLALIERDPRVLWVAFEEHFGFGYFKRVIEEDYGLVQELDLLKKELLKTVEFDKIEL
jgi:hypothetical protein